MAAHGHGRDARMAPEVPALAKAASMIESLVEKPENGGTPMMAR